LKGVGVTPSLLSISRHPLRSTQYKTLDAPQSFTPSFELVLCELLFVCGKMDENERSSLSNLASYANVKGEEAVGRRVQEEMKGLERTGPENEVERDVLLLRRRRRLYLGEEYVRLFADTMGIQ